MGCYCTGMYEMGLDRMAQNGTEQTDRENTICHKHSDGMKMVRNFTALNVGMSSRWKMQKHTL